MKRQLHSEEGFTLVELMITMAIFVLALAAASQMFVGLLSNFKQQTRIAESNIEGVVGLEMMRADIEQAGFGLYWHPDGESGSESAGIQYAETGNAAYDEPAASSGTGKKAPRAFVIGNGTEVNGSDRLVIKATNVAINDTAQRWTYIMKNPGAASMRRDWTGTPSEQLAGTDYTAVLDLNQRKLITNGSIFSVQMNDPNFSFNGGPVPPTYAFEPIRDTDSTFVAYGIKPNDASGAPRMPFNRAEYHISVPVAGLPTRCAQGTGILYKATVNQKDGLFTELPVLDCVLDMQVVFALDTNGDGTADIYDTGNAINGLTAQQVRDQVKEVRVYIIAQEGQRDTNFTYTNPRSVAGNADYDAASQPGDVDILDRDIQAGATRVVKRVTVPDRNCRWKLYNLILTPYNLR